MFSECGLVTSFTIFNWLVYLLVNEEKKRSRIQTINLQTFYGFQIFVFVSCFFFLSRVSMLTRSNSKKFSSSLCAFPLKRTELSRGQFDFKPTSQLVLDVGQSADWEL